MSNIEPDKIRQLRTIAESCQRGKVDGVTVDLFTASAIVAVYDRLGESNRAKFLAMPIARMADVAFVLA